MSDTILYPVHFESIINIKKNPTCQNLRTFFLTT